MDSLTTSIIIINKSDPRVELTLEALHADPAVQSANTEIIVVDASSGGLGHLHSRFPDVRWIPFEAPKGSVTIPHQRNVGLQSTEADIVVFTDAACLPKEDWLERLTAPIRDGEDKIVAGVALSPEGSLRDEAVNRIADERYLREAPTINLAIDREVIAAVGGFDERFAYGSDVDFSWRAIDAGFRIRNRPDAVVVHDWGTPAEELHRSWRYGRARARLYLKHKHRWRDLFGCDLPLVAYPVYLLALPITFRRPWLHLSLLLPIYRNRGRRPVVTLADHFIRGAAAIVELSDHVVGSH